MKAMILSAGQGSRLKPLTNHTPKVMIEVAGKPLICHHIEKLKACGIDDIVINLAHLGDKIKTHLGDGKQWGVSLHYSQEPTGGLETGGGLKQALPLLGDQSFIAINGDIYTDYDYSKLPSLTDQLAHLVLIPNPAHNPTGDFSLSEQGRVTDKHKEDYTFSGIALYHPKLLSSASEGKYSIVPLLNQAITNNLVSGEVYQGHWHDIGTSERLDTAREAYLRSNH